MLLTIALAVVAITFAHIAGSKNERSRSDSKSSIPKIRDVRPAPIVPLTRHASQTTVDTTTSTTVASAASGQPTAPILVTASPPSGAASRTAPSATDTSQPSDSSTYTGYLSYPDDVESLLSVPLIVGSLTVEASWTGGNPLQLTLTCASLRQASVGTAEVSVTMSDVDSACTVRLLEQVPAQAPVSYNLNITHS